MSALIDPDRCLGLITAIAACSLLVHVLQTLWNRDLFRAEGLLGWELLKTQSRFVRYGASPLLDGLYRFPNVLAIVALQGVAAVMLLVFPGHPVIQPLSLSVIVAGLLLDRVRNQPYTLVAADTMALLVFGALYLRELSPTSDVVTRACLWFIALQSCLSYAANGLIKLAAPEWRRGTMLARVAHHPLYESPVLARVLRASPRGAKWLDWSVIACESAFPLVLVVGSPACWVFLAWGLAFHVLIALGTGLNRFLLAWAATYPAIVFVALG
jgi:hypothetical protein